MRVLINAAFWKGGDKASARLSHPTGTKALSVPRSVLGSVHRGWTVSASAAAAGTLAYVPHSDSGPWCFRKTLRRAGTPSKVAGTW